MVLKPQDNKKLLPRIRIEVLKEKKVVDELKLEGSPFHIFGTMSNCDFPVLHKSISRRHCCIEIDINLGVSIIDLGSKGGTIVNGERLTDHFPFKLKPNDVFRMAESSRSY